MTFKPIGDLAELMSYVDKPAAGQPLGKSSSEVPTSASAALSGGLERQSQSEAVGAPNAPSMS